MKLKVNNYIIYETHTCLQNNVNLQMNLCKTNKNGTLDEQFHIQFRL